MSGFAELPERLLQAGVARAPLPPAEGEGVQVVQGYVLQREGLSRRIQAGEQLTGWKVAFAGAAAQRRFGLSEPVYGGLTSSMAVAADTTVALSSLIQPKLEVELVLIIGRDLEPAFYSDDEILAAVSGVTLAFEIADCRWQGWQFGAGAFLADNSAAALYLLGPVEPFDAARHAIVEFALYRDGLALGGGVAGHGAQTPLANLCWLVRRLLSDQHVLRTGQVILSGALLAPLAIEAGEYRLEMLGTELALRFAAD